MAGHFTSNSLVYKSGMAEGIWAGDVDELKEVFSEMSPLPTQIYYYDCATIYLTISGAF